MKLPCTILLLLVFQVVGQSATILVPGDYGTIQAAINNASNGDLIEVAAGTYMEQLTVSGKSIEIKGAGLSQTWIQSPPFLSTSFVTSAANKCIVGVIDGANLVIRNLTIDGLGQGNINYRFTGIGFRNSSGAVRYCSVKNIQNTPFNGNQHGICIYAYNTDGTNRTVTLNNCYVSAYQKTGIALNGNNLLTTVKDCVVYGAGKVNSISQNGIQIGYGASGTIDHTIVVNNNYGGVDYTSSGILIYHAGNVDVINCTGINDNQMGVYYIKSMGNYFANTISAGTLAKGGNGEYYGLGVDDQGDHGPKVEPYGDGVEKPSTRSTTTVQVTNSIFTSDHTATGIGIGAWAQNSDNVVLDIRGCTIQDWTIGIEAADDGTATANVNVRNCEISGNTDFGISNTTFTQMSAVYNNWGDASGPYHPTLNPAGLGDTVSNSVLFDPWLTGSETLDLEKYILHANQNDSILFYLTAGAAQGNRTFYILGSITGTEPGLPLPGKPSNLVTLPLNWDFFTELMLKYINSSVFQNFRGTLSALGGSVAKLNSAGPLDPNTVGLVMYYAYLLYYPIYWPYDFVSNPVEIKIVP